MEKLESAVPAHRERCVLIQVEDRFLIEGSGIDQFLQASVVAASVVVPTFFWDGILLAFISISS